MQTTENCLHCTLPFLTQTHASSETITKWMDEPQLIYTTNFLYKDVKICAVFNISRGLEYQSLSKRLPCSQGQPYACASHA